MHFQFDPPFLPMQTGLLAVLAIGLVLGLYLRRELRDRARRSLPLIGLRSLLLLALAFILLNPVIVRANRRPRGKSPFVVLLDTSRSMRTADGENGQARYAEATRRTLGNSALMNELAQRYDLRLFQFADKPTAATADTLVALRRPDGGRTNLGGALAGAVNGLGAAARGGGQILLVSDGRDNSDSFPLD